MLHPPSQAVTTMPTMTRSGSGWEGGTLFHGCVLGSYWAH